MVDRRALIGIVLFGALLQVQGIARTWLPAQDGLKYIHTAQVFQQGTWFEAVRGTDQHPLYPMAIALTQPLVSVFGGQAPSCWRITAQVVSALAFLLAIVPIYAVTREQFGEVAGRVSALFWIALPIPADIGHDTLSDSLGLLCFSMAFWQGERWLATWKPTHGIRAGVAAGLGFWTRPEIAVIGIVLIGLGLARWAMDSLRKPTQTAGTFPSSSQTRWQVSAATASLTFSFLGLVGLYTMTKGEVSEKLTVRLGLGLTPSAVSRAIPEKPDFELSGLPPKEESQSIKDHATLAWAGQETANLWLRTVGFFLAPLALVGGVRAPASSARLLARVYIVCFLAVLVRHAAARGYLSHRHVLTLTIVCLPWASWRFLCLIQRVGDRVQLSQTRRCWLTICCVAVLMLPGVVAQCKPVHPSRMGHWLAGRWLADHANNNDAVLDTRCWAGFLSGRKSYDTWHLRQALSDPALKFVVVETRELNANSDRAARLGAWLERNGTLAVKFPEQPDGITDEVLIYRYQPASSQGVQP